MPYQPTTWNTGEPVSGDKLSKMNNNDNEIYQSYYERARGIIGHKYMIPASGNKTTITKAPVTLITMSTLFYPDRVYLMEVKLSRVTCIVSNGYCSVRLSVDGEILTFSKTHVISTSNPNRDTSVYIPWIVETPSNISAIGKATTLLVDAACEVTNGAEVYHDSSSTAGYSSLFVTDLGAVSRSNLL